MAKKIQKIPLRKTKDSFVIEKPIEVDGNASTLVVKIDITQGKGVNWKITGAITTSQVSTTSEEITEGTLSSLTEMMRQAIEKAIEKRHAILMDMSGGDPDQLALMLGGQPEEGQDDLPM